VSMLGCDWSTRSASDALSELKSELEIDEVSGWRAKSEQGAEEGRAEAVCARWFCCWPCSSWFEEGIALFKNCQVS